MNRDFQIELGRRFLRLHESGTFLMPNAWDAGSALLLQTAGFEAIGTTSAGIAYALGKADATGTLSGIRPGLLGPGHLYRAALEGTSLSLALGIDLMVELGVSLESVRLVGGGARNSLWRSILADALEVPVQRLVEAESAALGGAIQALWTVRRQAEPELSAHEVASPFVHLEADVAEPDATRVEVYREAKVRFSELRSRVCS